MQLMNSSRPLESPARLQMLPRLKRLPNLQGTNTASIISLLLHSSFPLLFFQQYYQRDFSQVVLVFSSNKRKTTWA